MLYHTSFAIYNLYFHALSGYAGPHLTAASSLWYTHSLTRGTIAQDTLALHKHYNKVVRITPDKLSYVNPDNWKKIYGNKPGSQELFKDPRYHDTVKPTPTILTGDREEHSYYRKILSNTFLKRTLKEQEYVLHNFVNLFIRKLHKACKEGEKQLKMTTWWNVGFPDSRTP